MKSNINCKQINKIKFYLHRVARYMHYLQMYLLVYHNRQKEKLACNLPVATGFGVIQNQRRNNLRSTAATFDCPYCSVRKLGRESLLQHVLSNHKGEDPHVVRD